MRLAVVAGCLTSGCGDDASGGADAEISGDAGFSDAGVQDAAPDAAPADAALADAGIDRPDAGPPGPCNPAPAETGPYEADPEILAALEALPARSGWRLPSSTVNNEGVTTYGSANGPPHRDYSNAMVFVPERSTALYAGGSHGTYRGNDVWEYDLASNTWQILFHPTGGNAGVHKAGVFALRHWIDEGREPSAELMGKILEFKAWAQEHTHFVDGRISTIDGGPIMPSHQWDGLTYDPRARRMLWRSGASADFSPAAVAYIFDLDLAEVEATYDHSVTRMWSFDPEARRWERYAHDGASPRSALSGMGASLTYIPELCASIHYASAQNVTPPVFEMWTHDFAEDRWTELQPNGGSSIYSLSITGNDAPTEEAQMAYSPLHQSLVAVLNQDTYVYDLMADEWSHVVTDERLRAHDARTVFVYDSTNDVFLLQDMDEPDAIYAFSLEAGAWERIEVLADPFSPPPYDRTMGYYDPRHNVLVIGNGRNRGMWVFRYE